MKNRVLSRDVKSHDGKTVLIQGWLHKTRKMGGLTFINVRDRSGLTQVLVEDKDEQEKLRGMQIGTVLYIEGKVVADDRAPGGAELHEPKITVEVPVTETPPIEIDKPIDHKSENHDTLFEHRALNLRNLNEQKIFRVRSLINKYIRQYLLENEFVEIQTPKMLAGATEGGAEVFKFDYFGKEATLAQSPQFYKQMMVGVFERVFEIGPAFRAEPSMTTRHISETTMLDIEMGFIESHDDVLVMTEGLVNYVVSKLWDNHEELLKPLNATRPKLTESFPRITVAEVHELYEKETGEKLEDKTDLIPAEERFICEYAKKKHGCEAVFVTQFPVEVMKFYHMQNPDNPKTVMWADLLFRGLELATAPQREHNYEKMVQQLKDAGLDLDHPGFKYYLQGFKYGLPPHGGF
ncbi:MAG: aspartate--tRNA(Asn) ligase, partial [Candidatus Saccharimonadales bacterium]|nr:aspartate--tRNA(Asn) ligase [Candidatus Saccharimonadales bacterium]